jgi:hypothetical protein
MIPSNLMIPQLFIPAVRVYSVKDNIPFHLQLSGSRRSVQNFLMPPSQEDVQVIRVTLLRQMVVETRGQTSSRYTVLAEGKLSEIPPLVSPPCEPGDSIHLNWDGEIMCSSDTSVGGFDAGNIAVKVSSLVAALLIHGFTHFDYLGLCFSQHKPS